MRHDYDLNFPRFPDTFLRRHWVASADIDAGKRDWLTSEDRKERGCAGRSGAWRSKI